MKRLLFLVLVVALLGACGRTKDPAANEPELDSIMTGDLLLVGLPYDYSLVDTTTVAVDYSGGVNYIHVAILERHEDSVWVIDATIKHGVDRYPLDTFLADFTLRDGTYPRFEVMRLKDNSQAPLFVEKAKAFVGREYDIAFDLENEAQYCSELVCNSYVTPQGDSLFQQSQMDFHRPDGVMPPYWEELFGYINTAVPQGMMGSTPKSLAEDSALRLTNIEIKK